MQKTDFAVGLQKFSGSEVHMYDAKDDIIQHLTMAEWEPACLPQCRLPRRMLRHLEQTLTCVA